MKKNIKILIIDVNKTNKNITINDLFIYIFRKRQIFDSEKVYICMNYD